MKAQHPELGAALKALTEARGVSQARLARIAGVSRRHVSVALAGGNITISILKKLMRALRAESIPIGELSAVSGELAGVDAAVLVAVADQLDHRIGTISAAATSLRMYSKAAAPPTAVDADGAADVGEREGRGARLRLRRARAPDQRSGRAGGVRARARRGAPPRHAR